MGEFKNNRESVMHVKSGHAAVLDLAEIDSVPVPSVVWETKQGPIKNGLKYFLTTKNQLVILSADDEDNGAGFRAKATNTQIGKEAVSSFIYMNVTGDDHSEIGPVIVISLQNQKVMKGKSVEFECIANARPLYEVEIQWFKDGKSIESTNIAHALEWWNRTLVLLSVDSTYKGEYECRVQMKTGGYNEVTSKASLTVLEPPEFKSTGLLELVAEYSSKLEVPCEASGTPEPLVTWFRNAEAIDLSHSTYKKRNDNTLVIEKVGLEDSGVFQCLASNEAGEKSSYAWIKVKSMSISIAHTISRLTFTETEQSRKELRTKADEKFSLSSDVFPENQNLETFEFSKNFAKKFIRDKRLAQPRIIGEFSSILNELTVQNCKSQQNYSLTSFCRTIFQHLLYFSSLLPFESS